MNHPDYLTHKLPEHSIKLPPWGATLRSFRAEGKRFGVWLASCALVLADHAEFCGGDRTDETKKVIADALAMKLNATLDYLRQSTGASQSQIEAFREAALNKFPQAKGG
jgi:predicted trehalose synthase